VLTTSGLHLRSQRIAVGIAYLVDSRRDIDVHDFVAGGEHGDFRFPIDQEAASSIEAATAIAG